MVSFSCDIGTYFTVHNVLSKNYIKAFLPKFYYYRSFQNLWLLVLSCDTGCFIVQKFQSANMINYVDEVGFSFLSEKGSFKLWVLFFLKGITLCNEI